MYVVEVKGTGYLDTTRTKKEVEILKEMDEKKMRM